MERDQSSPWHSQRGEVVLRVAGVWNRRRRRSPLGRVPASVLRQHLGYRRGLHLRGERLVRRRRGVRGEGGAVGWVGPRQLERNRGRLILWKLNDNPANGESRPLRAGVLPPGADLGSIRRRDHHCFVRGFFPDYSWWQDLLSTPRNEHCPICNPVLLPLPIQRLVRVEHYSPLARSSSNFLSNLTTRSSVIPFILHSSHSMSSCSATRKTYLSSFILLPRTAPGFPGIQSPTVSYRCLR